ncbi:flagellar motor switch protein FliN [Fibrobacteres bacterium R8-0-B4]
MSDYLSQDEIDSLLNGLSEGEGGASDERYKAIAPVFELFCKQASSVLGTAAARTVDVNSESCAKADYNAAKAKLPGNLISLTLPLVSGLEGEMYLIMDKKVAGVLVDLMMMGDGTAPYTDESKDAISELFNQVMGAFSTALGGDLGESVSAGNVSVSEFNFASPPFDATTTDMGMAKFNVTGLASSYITVLIPNAFGDEIVEKKVAKSSPAMADLNVGISQSEMDALTNMSMSNFDSSGGGGGGSFGAQQFAPPPPPPRQSTYDGPKENIDLLLDVELDINIELGKSELSIKRILELAPGSIVELDKMAGEPVDLIVNNKVVAKGEVVVVDENFGIRIVSLLSAEDRVKSLK